MFSVGGKIDYGTEFAYPEELQICLDKHGLTQCNPPKLYFYSPISKVWKIDCKEAVVWFKENPAIFAGEGSVTSWLYHANKGYIPQVLSWGHSWIATRGVAETDSFACYKPLFRLAKIQFELDGTRDVMLKKGLRVRDLSCLAESLTNMYQSGWLAAVLGERISASELNNIVKTSCTTIENINCSICPDTIVHGDFQTKNTVKTESGTVILDWSDAAIGNPFVDISVYLKALRIGSDNIHEAKADLLSYAEVWQSAYDQELIYRSLHASPIIGALYQLQTHQIIHNCISENAGKIGVLAWTLNLRSWIEKDGIKKLKQCLTN